MSGKIIGGILLASALIAGIAIYYLQIYAFYDEIQASGASDVELTLLATGQPEPILHTKFEAIDSESSPIRFRACFSTDLSQAFLTETFELYGDAEPRVAPGWFECFDAEAIGAQIADGSALVFTGQRNIEYGIDRVVAITADGRGFIWHEINECGDKAYDGSPLGKDCPERDAESN